MTPLQQLKAIRKYLHQEKELLERYFNEITSELEKENLFIKHYENLDENLNKNVMSIFSPIFFLLLFQ